MAGEVAIETADGAEQTLPVNPDEVSEVLEEARAAVADFNRRATLGFEALEAGAQPSVDACGFCEGRIACEPYWGVVKSDWSTRPCFRGTVTQVLDIGHAVSVSVVASEPGDRNGITIEVFGPTERAPSVGDRGAVVGAFGDPTSVKVRLAWDTRVSWEQAPSTTD